ncbi:hypothetical protein [Paenibacillus nuruki]|uniref:hypothetical protein n=1 Tax=Paenibacillus nuruki TaxID=1886670 RepID=UPI001586E4F9|nr:hypothetical protein [Paenibacillus nuruki]
MNTEKKMEKLYNKYLLKNNQNGQPCISYTNWFRSEFSKHSKRTDNDLINFIISLVVFGIDIGLLFLDWKTIPITLSSEYFNIIIHTSKLVPILILIITVIKIFFVSCAFVGYRNMQIIIETLKDI